MNDIIGAIIGGLVVLAGAFLFRKQIFGENQVVSNKPLPKAPEPQLTPEKSEEIREELKKESNTNLAKLFLSKLIKRKRK